MKNILFIGSFKLPKDGSYGGVYFASNSLKKKLLIEDFEIVELDTTLKSIKQISVWNRIPSILGRNVSFVWNIMIGSESNILIAFLSAGNSYLDKLPSILLAKFLKKKVIVFPVSGFLTRDFEKKLYSIVIKLVFENSDFVICQSGFWKEFFISKGINEKKLIVIENWVEHETLIKSKCLEFKKYYISEKEVFRLVYVSRIEVDKGILDVIEAVKFLKDKIMFVVHIYGSGSYESQLKLLIESEGLSQWIKFYGWLDKKDILKTVNSYHLALFTSRFEGYPNAVLDYIFSKTPVLSSDIPSVVAVGRGLITFYRSQDSRDLADKIIWCSSNYDLVTERAGRLLIEKEANNNINYAVGKLKNYL